MRVSNTLWHANTFNSGKYICYEVVRLDFPLKHKKQRNTKCQKLWIILKETIMQLKIQLVKTFKFLVEETFPNCLLLSD